MRIANCELRIGDDVVLNDAFNILGEVVDAIEQVEQFNQQGESGHGTGN
ncbi:hypothetical protein COO91_09879 (plasmid) [Nostoc flagelliforme CCNUN1]|uniref:Uncharacterized protein n=1 Tax=Nostoc flagelliforme CCNUN1 TaxID=2038116 RepID=A0A2K8T9F2_9NOSO|nr:hypothetical protein [Nostoc flagelliforme]AUB43695.1 hypothetical protein COO91_09879 [Nostoc flagelliforme CCNUN1]